MDNDKSYHSSGDSSALPPSTSINTNTTTTTTATDDPTTNNDHFLRHLNKLSHKISKPSTITATRRPPPELPVHHRHPPPQPPPPTAALPPQQQQPPVYNINKSDFRDVVQKLTGSPAHHAPSPPHIHAPKPASSRLQRIRPPPLVQLNSRPPPLLNCAVGSANQPNPNTGVLFRPPAPLSPLPPFPTCHAAAESPISAYMRFLHTSMSAVDSDPKFNNLMTLNAPQMLPQSPPPPSSSSPMVPPPSSPLPFGCFPSPKSPCPLLSPNLLLSPTGTGPLGFPQLPISPTVPGVSSPKWRDL